MMIRRVGVSSRKLALWNLAINHGASYGLSRAFRDTSCCEGIPSNDDSTMATDSADNTRGGGEADKYKYAYERIEGYTPPLSMSRKERMRIGLSKLKKGPNGKYINAFEVTTSLDILLASYQSLKAESKPSHLWEDSDGEEDASLEDVDIERFERLQAKLRSGTFQFQPALHINPEKKKVK